MVALGETDRQAGRQSQVAVILFGFEKLGVRYHEKKVLR